MGMSREEIRNGLLVDLKDGGRLFGEFRNAIKNITGQAITNASATAERFEYEESKVKEFVFVAQEKKPPYASKVFRMTEELMNQGWDRMSIFLEEYANHGKGGHLSIYNSPNIVDLVL